jgi:hypothetical protein
MPFGPHEWVDAFWGVSILIPPAICLHIRCTIIPLQ